MTQRPVFIGANDKADMIYAHSGAKKWSDQSSKGEKEGKLRAMLVKRKTGRGREAKAVMV